MTANLERPRGGRRMVRLNVTAGRVAVDIDTHPTPTVTAPEPVSPPPRPTSHWSEAGVVVTPSEGQVVGLAS